MGRPMSNTIKQKKLLNYCSLLKDVVVHISSAQDHNIDKNK